MLSVNSVNTTDVYTDFSGLAKLKNQAKKDSPEAVKAVAKQFEALFLQNILKSMRQAKLADGMMDSDQTETYTEMYDQQLALHLSNSSGVGLADLIVKQLEHNADAKKMTLADYQQRSAAGGQDVTQYHRGSGRWVTNNPFDEEISLKNQSHRPIKSAEDFIQQVLPYAHQAAMELGVDPKVLVAQAALETGWGRSVIKNRDGSSSFNLFNIKADRSWHGRQAQVPTLEFEDGIAKKVSAGFRSYGSFAESFQDYVHFIQRNPRYSEALKNVDNGDRYLRELQRAGYATDPHYANKVMAIYHDAVAISAKAETVATLQ